MWQDSIPPSAAAFSAAVISAIVVASGPSLTFFGIFIARTASILVFRRRRRAARATLCDCIALDVGFVFPGNRLRNRNRSVSRTDQSDQRIGGYRNMVHCRSGGTYA